MAAALLLVTVAPVGCKPRSEPGGSAASQGLPSQQPAGDLAREITTPEGIEMVLVPGGEFMMGNPGNVDSRPVHKVTLGAFYMDRHEVTQEFYERVMGHNPSRRKGAKNPVERVRWSDAIKFCNARSEGEGLRPCYDLKARTCDFAAGGYRLPTEAEWEYACRAGSQRDYHFDGGAAALDAHAWFKGNARRKHRPVGGKPPNRFGLHDMAGNVREWCNDWYQVDYYAKSPAADPRGPGAGEKTVLRGGAFSATAESCTKWARYCDDPGFTDACVASDDYGFRCVKSATAPGRDRP